MKLLEFILIQQRVVGLLMTLSLANMMMCRVLILMFILMPGMKQIQHIQLNYNNGIIHLERGQM